MEARYDEVLGEKEKLSALGQNTGKDFDVDGLPTIAPFRKVLGGVGGTPVISAGGYDAENCWEAVDSGVSATCSAALPRAQGRQGTALRQ